MTTKVEIKQDTVVTPSGIEVLYQSAPKRLYRVRRTSGPEENREPTPGLGDWFEVPSVTTVLGVLDKPALPWWGMTIGVEGVVKLHNLGLLRSVPHGGQNVLACPAALDSGQSGLVVAGVSQIVDLLNREKLTVNHVRDHAGDRGQAVHDALEVWAKEGTIPDPEMFPAQEQGYVIGLCQFLEHAQLKPEACEVMVGSVEHGYAGRYDLRARTTKDVKVVHHRTPAKGAQWAEIPAGKRLLLDLKTSKGVYPSHSRQLEAYEQASVECGYEPTDARGILNVAPDGTYKFVRSTAVFEDFRVVLDVWRSDQDMKERKR